MKVVRSFFSIIKSITLLIFLFLLVVFMVHNREMVTLHLAPLPFDIETRMFIVMIGLFILGMIFSFMALSHNIAGNIINKHKVKKLEKKSNKN